MNMYDIARETGFSIATISRAINNSGYVSAKTREKIMKVIEEKGYSVNAFAKGMATSSMSLAGILCSDSRDTYQAECIYHLQNDLKDNGFTALLACTGDQLKDKQEAVSLLLSRNVDVIFLIGSHFVEDTPRGNFYLREASRKVPIIMLNGLLEADNVYSIRCDDASGMMELTNLVMENGAKKPLLISRRDTFSTREKLRGFKEAMYKYDQKLADEPRIVEIDADRLYPSLEEQLKQAGEFDALLCMDDELAANALKYCQSHHIKVPADCQITGYNNNRLSDLPATSITSYDNRIPYLCTTSVFCMNQVLDKKDYPSQTVYSGLLKEKKTTRNAA